MIDPSTLERIIPFLPFLLPAVTGLIAALVKRPAPAAAPQNDPGATTDDQPVPPPEEEPKHVQLYDWGFDNGHGIFQPGKRSEVLPDGRQLEEWKFNRIIARGVVARLKQKGVSAWLVVPEDNVGSFLQGRVNRINERESDLPKLAVSIHANAGPTRGHNQWSTARGTETWYFHTSELGQAMAEVFQRHLVKRLGLRDRGVRSREESQFYILRRTIPTTILTECAFFNNRIEVEKLLDPNFQQMVIEAHVAAVMEIEETGL